MSLPTNNSGDHEAKRYDRFLVCVDCRNEFLFSASEQRSYHRKDTIRRNVVSLAERLNGKDLTGSRPSRKRKKINSRG